MDRTRDELGSTLEALGDRLAPAKVAGRVKERATEKVEDVKDKVSPARVARRATSNALASLRGTRETVAKDHDGDDVTRNQEATRSRGGRRPAAAGGAGRDRAGAVVGRVAGEVGEAPAAARRRLDGNPLVAGMVAFAGGFLVASRLRPTGGERQLAERARAHLEPVAQQALETGRAMAEDLRDLAQEGLGEVRQRAAAGADEVKDQAVGSVELVKDEAAAAAVDVRAEVVGPGEGAGGEAGQPAGPVRGGAGGSATNGRLRRSARSRPSAPPTDGRARRRTRPSVG